MQSGKITKVIVGADQLAQNGILHKIGTYQIALVAKHFKVPFMFFTAAIQGQDRQ